MWNYEDSQKQQYTCAWGNQSLATLKLDLPCFKDSFLSKPIYVAIHIADGLIYNLITAMDYRDFRVLTDINLQSVYK